MAGSARSRLEVLSQVVPASAMPVFAHERLIPVPEALSPLFAVVDGSPTVSPVGLVRGQTVQCTGSAAVSCALGLAAAVTQSGSWVAFVALPSIGLAAAATTGVSLDRAVFVRRPVRRTTIDTVSERGGDGAGDDVGAALSALVDGMDMVVVSRRLVSNLRPSLVRRLQSRAQSKGSVFVILGDVSGAVSVDLRLTARTVRWEGLGAGYGHLRRRLVSIDMDGRRCPRRRDHIVWLPDVQGGLSAVDDETMNSITNPMTNDTDGVVIALPNRRDIDREKFA